MAQGTSTFMLMHLGHSLTVDSQLSIQRKLCLTEALSSKRGSQLIWIGDGWVVKEDDTSVFGDMLL